MVTIGIISILLGATLAQYFGALSLVPFCAVALASTVAAGLVWGNPSEYSIVSGAVAVVAIQLGYFLGLAVRQLITASKHPELTKSGHEHAFPSKSRH